MGFKTEYTPYVATGQLATAAGAAQQRVREQQYAKAEAAQTAQVAANADQQAKSIAANRQLQSQQLLQNQNQFNQNLTLKKQEAVSQGAARITSSAASLTQAGASMRNALTNAESVALGQERFETEFEARQTQWDVENQQRIKTFELQNAAAERMQQKQDAADERQNLLNLENVVDYNKKTVALQGIQDQLAINDQNLADGLITQPEHDDIAYRVSTGKALRPEKELTPYQQESLRARETKPLSDNDVKGFDKIAFGILGGKTSRSGEKSLPDNWFRVDKTNEEMIELYRSFALQAGYSSRNATQQAQLDSIWDNTASIGGDRDYVWDPSGPEETAARNALKFGEQVAENLGITSTTDGGGEPEYTRAAWYQRLSPEVQAKVPGWKANGATDAEIERELSR